MSEPVFWSVVTRVPPELDGNVLNKNGVGISMGMCMEQRDIPGGRDTNSVQISQSILTAIASMLPILATDLSRVVLTARQGSGSSYTNRGR